MRRRRRGPFQVHTWRQHRYCRYGTAGNISSTLPVKHATRMEARERVGDKPGPYSQTVPGETRRLEPAGQCP